VEPVRRKMAGGGSRSMSNRFAVVHEAAADFHTATDLADHVLLEAIDWLDQEILPHQREWLDRTPGADRLTWKGMKRLAHEAGIRAHGHFNDGPGAADAVAARRAILFLWRTFKELDAIVLIRDQDDQPERQRGLDQARNSDRSGKPIVVGLAIVERES